MELKIQDHYRSFKNANIALIERRNITVVYVTNEEHQKAFEDEYNCKLELVKGVALDWIWHKMVFESEKEATMFILKWS